MSVYASGAGFTAEISRHRRRHVAWFGVLQYGTKDAAFAAAKEWEQAKRAELASGVAAPPLVRGVSPRSGACVECSWILEDQTAERCGPRDNGCCYRRRAEAVA